MDASPSKGYPPFREHDSFSQKVIEAVLYINRLNLVLSCGLAAQWEILAPSLLPFTARTGISNGCRLVEVPGFLFIIMGSLPHVHGVLLLIRAATFGAGGANLLVALTRISADHEGHCPRSWLRQLSALQRRFTWLNLSGPAGRS